MYTANGIELKRLIRRIIGLTNLAVAIALVLSFLSPNVSPAKIWGPSFMGLAYPYILLLNVLFMIFWILMKKKEFIISFLAILLGWNTLTDYFSIHPSALFRRAYFENLGQSERQADRQIKVTSFNVRAFNEYNWAGDPSTGNEIISMLRSETPDVICLQEYYRSRWEPFTSDSLLRALDMTPFHHIEYSINNRDKKYGLAIFSHYTIVGTGKVDLDEPLSLCAWADILVGGDTLRIYNMHLQSIRLSSRHYRMIDSLRFRYDDQQMEEIRDLSTRLRDAFIKRAAQADRIASHMACCPYPIIACGDFNDTPVSYTYKQIRAELNDVFAECGWGAGRTYNGKFPSFRIDYILSGSEFESLHFTRKKVRLSDHFPITAYLRII
jgi:endonuclease/exonuclease/phosphatase family metal-dependent hydrolase